MPSASLSALPSALEEDRLESALDVEDGAPDGEDSALEALVGNSPPPDGKLEELPDSDVLLADSSESCELV